MEYYMRVKVWPQSYDSKQNEARSGKKRRTMSLFFITDKDGIILSAGRIKQGDMHNMTAMRPDVQDLGWWKDSVYNEETAREGHTRTSGDLGCRGLDDDMPGTDVIAPIKKPRGRRSRSQKKHDKNLSYRRNAKNAIGEVMQYGMIHRKYHGTDEKFERELNVVCGLVNFRRMQKNGTYDKWMRSRKLHNPE